MFKKESVINMFLTLLIDLFKYSRVIIKILIGINTENINNFVL